MLYRQILVPMMESSLIVGLSDVDGFRRLFPAVLKVVLLLPDPGSERGYSCVDVGFSNTARYSKGYDTDLHTVDNEGTARVTLKQEEISLLSYICN